MTSILSNLNFGIATGVAAWRARVKTAGGKFQYGIDLVARDVELLNDFVDGCASFEVFENRGYGHASVLDFIGADKGGMRWEIPRTAGENAGLGMTPK